MSESRFWVEGVRCPRCGASLVSDGEMVWCSFVGGEGYKACDYGLDGETVKLADIKPKERPDAN